MAQKPKNGQNFSVFCCYLGFCYVYIMRGRLCTFLYIWMMTSYPGSRTIHQILWFKVFLDSRLQYESLEGLMDILLVQKFWQNKQKLIRGIPTNSLGNSCKIRGLSAITWASETPGSRSRPLQLHIPA